MREAVTRLWMRAAMPLIVVLTSAISLIQARSYDDPRLQAFFTPPEGCPAPCFIGIQPGVTTSNQAIGILRESDWVDANSIAVSRDQITQLAWVYWAWNGKQPEFILGSGLFNYSTETGLTRTLMIRTRFTFGDLFLSFGQPDSGSLNAYQHVALYPQHDFFLINDIQRTHCGSYWFQRSDVYLLPEERFDAIREDKGVYPYEWMQDHWRILCR
jgi:hypothetical protein